MTIDSRGIRNKNPGNLIKNTTDKWQGLSEAQEDPKFFQFTDPTYGIRALARTLIAYQDKHDCGSVAEFIQRFAPPVENDSNAYANYVASHMKRSVNAPVDVHSYADLRPMVEGIIEYENGHPWFECYSDSQVTKSLVLAGVQPPKGNLLASRQVIGGSVAATATVLGPVIPTAYTQIDAVRTQIQPLTEHSEYIRWVFVALGLAGIALAIWAKIDERRKGVS